VIEIYVHDHTLGSDRRIFGKENLLAFANSHGTTVQKTMIMAALKQLDTE
jgi:hypothetical protein